MAPIARVEPVNVNAPAPEPEEAGRGLGLVHGIESNGHRHHTRQLTPSKLASGTVTLRKP